MATSWKSVPWQPKFSPADVRSSKIRILALLVAVVSACTSGTIPTSSTTTAVVPSTTTSTTLPDPCSDVFCVVYTIRPEAIWSDGRSVVADDFAFTLSLFLDPTGPNPGNPGYQLVTDFEVIDDATFLVALSEEFAAWRTLFDTVYPAHVEYDSVHPGPTSGPFQLVSWGEDEVVLSRSPVYVGPGDSGDIEEIRFVVSPGIRDMVVGFGTSVYDVIHPPPQDWILDEISGMSGVSYVTQPGPFWEQITFNHDDPLLAEPWIREAIVAALDREAILDDTVRTINPLAEPLGSTVWMEGSVHHRNLFDPAYDPERAVELLSDNGCSREASGPFVCNGRRVSFVWATTTGDPFRAAQLDRAVTSLSAVGIEVIPWRLAPSELFSTPILFGDHRVWQMLSFSWKASADPFLGDSMYQCTGDGPHGMGLLNVGRYCDAEVDRLIDATSRIMDPTERADIYNQADRLFLADHAMVPLYQRPSLLAWSSSLEGPAPNPWDTDLWNVGSWFGSTTVVVAIGEQPMSLSAPIPTDDGAALVMSALYRGAFMVTPDMQYLPSLVSGAEVLLRGGG